MEQINASDFKAHCLAILDRVQRTGHPVTILKRGKEVAQLVPCSPRERGFPQDTLTGTVEIHGDITAPVLPSTSWEALRES